MARQPWKLTSILYPLVVAALLPLTLHEALEILPGLVGRLEPPRCERERLQVPRYRAEVKPRAASG